jgi:predicted ATPase
VHPIGEQDLQNALSAAADAELVYVRGIAPDATYQFKHALIRDTAYAALLKTRRREMHRRVAQTIQENFRKLKDTHPEVLARHWEEAGEVEGAIAEWSRAGSAARARSAFAEAQQTYERALALLAEVPESPERDFRELDLRQSIIPVLQITRGWVAPETADATKRMAALAERRGGLTQLRNSLAARAFNAWMSGDLSTAQALADQALELALREGSAPILGHCYMLQVLVRYWRGDLAGAERYFATGFQFFPQSAYGAVAPLA